MNGCFGVRQPDDRVLIFFQVLGGKNSYWQSLHLWFHLLVLVHKDFSPLVSEGGISNCTCLRISAGFLVTAGPFCKISLILYFLFLWHLNWSCTRCQDFHKKSWAPENDWVSLFSVIIIIIHMWLIWEGYGKSAKTRSLKLWWNTSFSYACTCYCVFWGIFNF